MNKYLPYIAGSIDNLEFLHQRISQTLYRLSVGAFLCIMSVDQSGQIENDFQVNYRYKLELESDDSLNYQKGVKKEIFKLLEIYDNTYEYCMVFEINKVIINSCFVSFDSPVELEIAVDRAIATYQNQ